MESRRWHTWAYLAVVALNAVSYEWIPAGASGFHLTWNHLAVALGTVIAVWGVLKRREHPWLLLAGGIAAALGGAASVLAIAVFSGVLREDDRLNRYGRVLLAALAALVGPLTGTITTMDGVPIPSGEADIPALLLARALGVIVFVLVPTLAGSALAARRAQLYSLRERAEAAEAEREARAQAAVLEERTRIAGEMHDSLGHRLVLITTQAGGLEVGAARGPEFVEEHARIIGETARAALAELRATVTTLTTGEPTRTPAPGAAQIGALVERARTSGAQVSSAVVVPENLPPRVDAALYRIAQEGLTNALKHAPGRPVTLALSTADDAAHLTISNPLAGGAPTRGEGTGLTRLTERVAGLGGRLRAGDDGATFTLAAHLPLDPARERDGAAETDDAAEGAALESAAPRDAGA